MRIDLDSHPDEGCWISDDRINAFISARSGGVAEVGFHGLQPVSRNSRLLVSDAGVLTLGVHAAGEILFPCRSVEWTPGSIITHGMSTGEEFTLSIEAHGRSLTWSVSAPPGVNARATGRFSYRSFFTQVHGERRWSPPEVKGGTLELSCRDRIELHEWLSRTGPYAGDFLIPEPWRRILFTRRRRSGLATIDDLRAEFRDAHIVLYDSVTRIRVLGEAFDAVQDQEGCTFTAQLSRENRWRACLRLECSEDGEYTDVPAHPAALQEIRDLPEIDIPGHPHTARFFTTLPGIVRSCTVRDTGMTRGTPGAYYWIWAWDNLVTAIEMLRWGDVPGASRIVRFINAHRDAGDAIPARWTRTSLPLDTPPRGTFECLLLLLACQCAAEGAGEQVIHDIYPFAAGHLEESVRRMRQGGLPANIGFYPDLPLRFGRTESSAVAMETGTLYLFFRLLETLALQRGDTATARDAADAARLTHVSFEKTFWDEEKGFLIDSVDSRTGRRNEAYPLFTLMFMGSPLGLPLVRPHIERMAHFAREHFLTPHGTRLLPAGDVRSEGEDALSHWYPHWDLYLLKLLRRAGEREAILSWLRSTERVLGRLGYAPEFIAPEALEGEESDAWRKHGSVWNLNCATGWYRAIVEGLFGIEFDTGGMNVLPLDLDLPAMSLRGLRHRTSHWEINVTKSGGSTPELRVDGISLRGCMKIPVSYHDGGPHRLEVTYTAKAAPPCLAEIINAEVLETEGNEEEARVRMRGLGTVDIAFTATDRIMELRSDGMNVPFSAARGRVFLQLPLEGEHTLLLRRRK